MELLQRTSMVIGETKARFLGGCHVLIFGVGGVGGMVAEALTRSGIGALTLVDRDVFDATNLNRQIMATVDTIGNRKVDVTASRLLNINPNLVVYTHPMNLDGSTIETFHFRDYDYVVDAIDDVGAKLLLAHKAEEEGFKLISSMGAGNRLDPMSFKVADITKTHTDPLARVMRKKLKDQGVKHLLCVFSTEVPRQAIKSESKLSTPGSVSFVPPACGLKIASHIIRELVDEL
ncbi:tRNA threonylcarbamoyladenosine dehydratase [Peptoniphilus equinus]|uniref:tRNA threonylcarbamoyladenosine dehydratase n=1 Tax=Peptoniphilus equinus TaxID=3016343 RepID=A0ABY7QW66_9FIRM|nr:tRNA threonylcarbamoyladenosine dehydratase [Peptoniphilus equinus]WBW50611.1 tRNA threonylcarbamoyladenosine dehydratase [Peptoniphilus equinus]